MDGLGLQCIPAFLKVATKLVHSTSSLVHDLDKARLRIAPTKPKAACRSKPIRAELQGRLRESGVLWSSMSEAWVLIPQLELLGVAMWQTNVAQWLGNAFVDSAGWLGQELAEGASPLREWPRPACKAPYNLEAVIMASLMRT